MLTPSPTLCYPHTSSPNTSLQTTPKLPKRERLASFSRLIASENFTDIMPEKRTARKNRSVVKKIQYDPENVPQIRISPSSPQKKISVNSKFQDAVANCKDIEKLGLQPLPFSPNMIIQSPNYTSPMYQISTPIRSPLYISEHKGVFLGRGSFGNVTLCKYKDMKFALKAIHAEASFIGESNFINVRHPHLVAILHISQMVDKVFICMEYAGHCNLQHVLDTKSELDFPRRLSFTIQIALGLRHCHQHQIVHGDVKPANVIVSPYGICKLGDFGHSIKLDSPTNDRVYVMGTAAYAAPEVLKGAQPILSSDIYSFGILLWQVQTRDLPFAGEHPHVIIYKVAHYGFRPSFENTTVHFSEKYEKTAELCWKEDPNERLSISEVLQTLKSIEKDIKKTAVLK